MHLLLLLCRNDQKGDDIQTIIPFFRLYFLHAVHYKSFIYVVSQPLFTNRLDLEYETVFRVWSTWMWQWVIRKFLELFRWILYCDRRFHIQGKFISSSSLHPTLCKVHGLNTDYQKKMCIFRGRIIKLPTQRFAKGDKWVPIGGGHLCCDRVSTAQCLLLWVVKMATFLSGFPTPAGVL